MLLMYPLDRYSNIEGRGVSHVVAIGLEGRAEHGDDLAPQISSEGLAGKVHGVFAPTQVDLIYLAQERQGLFGSEFASPRDLGGSGWRGSVVEHPSTLGFAT